MAGARGGLGRRRWPSFVSSNGAGRLLPGRRCACAGGREFWCDGDEVDAWATVICGSGLSPSKAPRARRSSPSISWRRSDEDASSRSQPIFEREPHLAGEGGAGASCPVEAAVGEAGGGGAELDVGAGGQSAEEGLLGRLGHPPGRGEAQLEAAALEADDASARRPRSQRIAPRPRAGAGRRRVSARHGGGERHLPLGGEGGVLLRRLVNLARWAPSARAARRALPVRRSWSRKAAFSRAWRRVKGRNPGICSIYVLLSHLQGRRTVFAAAGLIHFGEKCVLDGKFH